MAIAVKDVRAVLEIAQHRRSMGHISTQQYYFRKKMGQQGLELAFLTKKSCFLADFFLSAIGGTPPPQRKKSAK